MSEHTISLAFSVWHHYLKQFTEKHQISLPIFPEQLKKVDISHFLPKAEKIVLGKLPEIHQDNEKLFSLFEHIKPEIEKSQFFYDFKPLSPNSIFPTKDVKGTDFSILWQQFVVRHCPVPKGLKHCSKAILVFCVGRKTSPCLKGMYIAKVRLVFNIN